MIRPLVIATLLLASATAFAQVEGSGVGTAGAASGVDGAAPAAALPAGSGQDAPGDAPDGSGQAAARSVAGDAVAPELRFEVTFPEGIEARVGLPVTASIELVLPPGADVTSIGVRGNRHIEVSSDVPMPDTGDGVRRRSVELVVFRSGSFSADGLEAVIIDGEGNQLRALSEPFTLEVVSTIINETNPAPAPSDPPMQVMTRDMRPVYAATALGCVLFGFLVALVWRRFKSEPEGEAAQAEVRHPAWEIAFEQLDRLRDEALLDGGEHLEFHMRLSEILRAYIGARFGFLAPEMTTTEIGAWLRRHEESTGTWRAEIVEVLGDMDIVKFARFVPPRELSERCYDEARRLVTELSARDRERVDEELEADEAVMEPRERDGAPEDPHAPSAPSSTASFDGQTRDEQVRVAGVAARTNDVDQDDGATGDGSEVPANVVRLVPASAPPADATDSDDDPLPDWDDDEEEP